MALMKVDVWPNSLQVRILHMQLAMKFHVLNIYIYTQTIIKQLQTLTFQLNSFPQDNTYSSNNDS